MRSTRSKAALGVLAAAVALGLSGCTNLFAPPLVAQLSADPTSGQAPLSVQFDLSGSTGPIETYTLSFGDGSAPAMGTDLGIDVVHTYAEPGTYTATLTVTGAQGQADDQVTIDVTAPPPSTPSTATLEAEPVSGMVSNAGTLAVTFHYSAEAAPDLKITRWELSFGGDDTDPLGAPVSLLRIPETEAEHSYGVRTGEAESTYTATFKVWDEESGASPAATDSVVITVQSPPPKVTDFTFTPDPEAAGNPGEFAFTAQAGAGKSLVKYTLESGDGWSLTEEGFSVPWDSDSDLTRSETHTYEKPGTYTARVTVWDDAGRQAIKELDITVTG